MLQVVNFSNLRPNVVDCGKQFRRAETPPSKRYTSGFCEAAKVHKALSGGIRAVYSFDPIGPIHGLHVRQ